MSVSPGADSAEAVGRRSFAVYWRCARRPLLSLVAVLSFWGALWAVGFPPPHPDDLFFVGAGIELAEHGTLANPLLRFWNPVASQRYYFHAPLYSYVVGMWATRFGVSSGALRALVCVLGSICSLALMASLRQRGHAGATLVPLFVAATLFGSGLRHDALGLALFTSGILLCAGPGWVRRSTGFLLVGLGVFTWPVLLSYGVLTALALAIEAARVDESIAPAKAFGRWVLSVVLAGGAAVLCLAAMIDGRINLFLADYMWHVRLVKRYTLLDALRHQFSGGFAEVLVAPVYVLLLVVGITASVAGRHRHRTRWLFVLVAASILLSAGVYLLSFHSVATLTSWLAIVILIGELRPPRLRRLLATVGALVFGLTQSYNLVRVVATDWRPRGQEAALRASGEQLRPLAVDAASARFVFDYRLPEGAFLWSYGGPPGAVWPPRLADLPRESMVIVSMSTLDMMERRAHSAVVELFGRQFRSMPRRPNEIVVRRAEGGLSGLSRDGKPGGLIGQGAAKPPNFVAPPRRVASRRQFSPG